jgi:TolB-like protein
VLYEMATGRRPFLEEQPSRLADSILRQTPVPVRNLNPRISPSLEAIILKCLEKDAENRYQSAKEAGVDLRRAGAGNGDVRRVVRKGPVRSRAFAVLGALAVTGLLFSLNVGGIRNRLLGGAPASASRITSLAVLPLEDFSHDPEQAFFSDGMTEELITQLAQVRALHVISRTSVMSYKGTHKPLPEIGRELHVDAIVEGSILRSGDRVRITAQLVETATDQHLWAKSFDRDLRDVLFLQSEVARNIAREIQANVTPKEEARLARSRRVNPAAHDDYLKGQYYWNQFTE